MTDRRLYSCFDFRLRSEIDLPELIAADDPADARPIVEVRAGRVPAVLPNRQAERGGLQVSEDAAVLTIAGTGRYLVRGGGEVVVEADPDGSARMVRLFLLGSTLAIVCHQRGLLPLHANAIVAGNGAHAFAGPSGAGKSTLAAYFARAGFDVLCDDVCVISFAAGGTPVAWPGLPRLKLWSDASAAFGHDARTLERAIDGMDKYHVPLKTPPEARPIPFRRLYLLERTGQGRQGAIVRLRGQEAMAAVMAQTYRGFYLPTLGLTARHFLQSASLAGQTEVYAVSRAWGYDVFEREAERLARHMLAQD